MKITKRQLRRIIKEEKAKLVREYYGSDIMDVPDTTPYEKGHNDYASWKRPSEFRAGPGYPAMPDDPEYMRGWEDAKDDYSMYPDPVEYE